MIKLALSSLLNRKNVLILIFLSLTLSVTLFLGVQRTKEISRSSFSRTISGTDLIIGARTGQVNLILYSVFHMGRAVNNMGYDSYLDLASRDEVEWAVPLSLGDSYRGYRVVGTTNDYFSHYSYGGNQKLSLKSGDTFSTPFSVVLGASVADEFQHKTGDNIIVSHGAGLNGMNEHDNLPFTVTAVLEKTGTPVDKSVFVPLEGITAIHLGWETGMQRRVVSQEQALSVNLEPEAVTSVLVGLKNRGAAFAFQRMVNDYADEPLMAILPGAALYELWGLMSTAETALTFISAAVVVLGLISLLTAQLAVMNQRRREMALFRSLGATPGQLFLLLFTESLLLTTAGCLSGMILLYIIQTLLSVFMSSSGFYLSPALPSATEWLYFLLTLVSGTLTGVIPALTAYRNSLSDGMSIRN
ncbi:MAG: ABC transporter permease [Spirochaetales bacterium]|nr:ABC transporter permease [Spirochaetales bacterium]